MVAIIDYRMGNLHSVQKACAAVGLESRIVSQAADLRKARGVILPGVGAFGMAMEHLRRQRLIKVLKETALSGKPFFGVCLGMQLLFDESEEFGRHVGLGIFPGRVRPFPKGLKVPHMGWNSLRLKKTSPCFQGVPEGTYMYFVHSFYCDPLVPELAAATTEYGQEITAAVARGSIFATQFHPEKSQKWGLKIYRNFARLVAQSSR
jgi:glutamine amidotransferase